MRHARLALQISTLVWFAFLLILPLKIVDTVCTEIGDFFLIKIYRKFINYFEMAASIGLIEVRILIFGLL